MPRMGNAAILVAAAFALSLAAMAAQAQTAPSQAAMARSLVDAKDQHDLSFAGLPIRQVKQMKVYNKDGERIGEVGATLVDTKGKVRALTIDIEDGILGLRAYSFMVPAERLTFDDRNKRFVLDIAAAELEALQKWAN